MAFNFWGIPSTIEKLPIQEPLQQTGINQLFQQGLQNFNPDIQEKYATEQFAKRIPGIAERLNMLSGGQGMSQASQYELGGLSKDLQSQLAGLRYQHGLNALKLGLTPQYEYLYRGEQPGLLEAGAQGLATSIGQGLPGLASQGAQYLANKFMGQQPQQGAAETVASSFAAPVGQAAGNRAVQALQGAATPAMQAEQAAKTAVENQTAQQLAQAAATGATGALGTAAGTAGAGKATTALTAAGAASLAPLATALGVPLALAATGLVGVKAYEYYKDLMESRFGTSIPPLPANWNELPGPERYNIQQGRQLSTPEGIIGHQTVEALEREFGIKANDKVPWEQRWQTVTDKISGLENELGIEPNTKIPWAQRYKEAKARKGKK